MFQEKTAYLMTKVTSLRRQICQVPPQKRDACQQDKRLSALFRKNTLYFSRYRSSTRAEYSSQIARISSQSF